jgi:hypothetical protein
MRRLLGFVAALVLGFGVLVPTALAVDPLVHTGRVLISTQGDVSIPAGDEADVVVVVEGNADIRGRVNTVVVVEGNATLTGATVETLVAVRGTVELGSGTVITGEVQRLDATVHQTGNATIQGGIVDLSAKWLEIGAVLAPALALLWLGFGLSTLVAGLLLAGLAARQVRSAEGLISKEPVLTFVSGILGVIVIPIVAVLLFPTVIGAPLGFSILIMALPMVAFAGYLVAATWVGEWVLRQLSATPRERPYLAVVLGVILLSAIGLVPVLGLVVAIASLFGFGSLLLLGIRTLAGSTPRPVGTAQPMPLATGA